MSVLWLDGNCPEIPEISDERIAELSERIRPIFKVGGGLYYMQPVDPRKTAFNWNPISAGPVMDAFEIARIETYHTCGYIALFKPSIAEVLAQIPDHLIDKVSMFETLNNKDTVACFSEGDGHRALTILYHSKPSWER